MATQKNTADLLAEFVSTGTGNLTALDIQNIIVSCLNLLDIPVSAFAQSLLASSSASVARTNLGCGTASTHPATDFANAVHTHAESDVTGLTADLAGKAATVHTHAASDITSGTVAPARLGSGTPGAGNFLRGDSAYANPSISQVTGLVSALAAKLANPATTGLAMGGFDVTNAGNITANHYGTTSNTVAVDDTSGLTVGTTTINAAGALDLAGNDISNVNSIHGFSGILQIYDAEMAGNLDMSSHDIKTCNTITANIVDASSSGTVKAYTLQISAGAHTGDAGDGTTVWIDGDGFLRISTGG